MTVSAANASSQNLASLVLQQLLSGSNSMATSGLPASVLQAVLKQTSAAQTSQAAPAAVTQGVQADLSTLQNYFKQNPDALATLLSNLQNSSATYNAAGTLDSGSSLLEALAGQSGSSSSSSSSLLTSLLGSQAQDPLLAALDGSGSSSSSTASSSSSLLASLLGSQSQDPLLAALDGSGSSSSSTLSLLG
jgi:hypothetical protein